MTLATVTAWGASIASSEARLAPPLPETAGKKILVGDAKSLKATIESAPHNTTVIIAAGTYRISGIIRMSGRKNVTIRSASGDPAKVVLNGIGWNSGDRQDDILRIGDWDNTTIAHLTFSDCRAYAVKVEAENHPKNININPSASSSQVTAEEFHVQGGICRNNFILPGPDAAIELWWVDDVKIYNNTVWHHNESGRGIRFGSRNRGVHIANNLVRGAIIRSGDGAGPDVRIENNVTGRLENYFTDPASGDLRLTSQAVEALNTGISLSDVTEDFDGRSRNARPDIGAAER
jgi:hypothetical protein